MSNIPHHLRASSSALTQIPSASVSPAFSNPGTNSGPAFSSAQQVLPAGGYQQVQDASRRDEEHKRDAKADSPPRSAAVLPTGAFTPKAGQTVESAVADILAGAQGDPGAMQQGFHRLVATRVAAGVEVPQVAVALMQSLESAAPAKDGKQAGPSETGNPVLVAALRALGSLPSVNLSDLLPVLLAQTGRPDFVVGAWALAMADKTGEINRAHWQTALEGLAHAAAATGKSRDWLGQGLHGVVSAVAQNHDDAHKALDRAQAAHQSESAAWDSVSETLGVRITLSKTAVGQAHTRRERAYRAFEHVADALGQGTRLGVRADLLGQAAVSLALPLQACSDHPPKYLAQVLRGALDGAGASLEPVAHLARAMASAGLAQATDEQRNARLRDVMEAIDLAADLHAGCHGGERSAASVDTGRAIKRLMIQLPSPASTLVSSADPAPTVAGVKGPLNG